MKLASSQRTAAISESPCASPTARKAFRGYWICQERLPESESFCIGTEATGHYWLALYSFLHYKGFALHAINPIQPDSLRNFHIRQQKTDAVDGFLVAVVIRFGKFTETHLADEDILVLRNLARFRESLKDSCADYKRQVITILDQVFLEYDRLFFDQFSSLFLLTFNSWSPCGISTKPERVIIRQGSYMTA